MNKYVLTGGPSCGKTTIINELKNLGYSVLEEVAREVHSEKKWQLGKELELEILSRQLKKERNLDPLNQNYFLDRGVYDIHAYCQHLLRHIPKEVSSSNSQYSLIFLLDLLPFENDGLRIEKDIEEAKQVQTLIKQIYENQGYTLIQVPVLPVKERTNFILNHIRSYENGNRS